MVGFANHGGLDLLSSTDFHIDFRIFFSISFFWFSLILEKKKHPNVDCTYKIWIMVFCTLEDMNTAVVLYYLKKKFELSEINE